MNMSTPKKTIIEEIVAKHEFKDEATSYKKFKKILHIFMTELKIHDQYEV